MTYRAIRTVKHLTQAYEFATMKGAYRAAKRINTDARYSATARDFVVEIRNFVTQEFLGYYAT